MQLASPPFHGARIAARRVFILLCACVTSLALTACGDDEEDGPLGGGSSIQGTWTLQEAEGLIYLRITSNTIRIYVDEGDCYIMEEADIVDSDGDIYTLSFEGVTEEVEIRRVGANLEADGEIWVPSNVNTGNLEICTGPDLGQCTALPQVNVGGSVSGSLASTDPANPDGSHFDLYRLQLGSTTNAGISMSSSTIDTWLELFAADGTPITYDDDGGNGTDSFIQQTLSAGCYIIMATSYDPDEFGTYTLSVSAL